MACVNSQPSLSVTNEGNKSRGGERKVLTTAVVAYSQELVRESLRGSHPGFQFFRKLLSELRPHVSPVASLCPQLSTKPTRSAAVPPADGTLPAPAWTLPCGFVLPQGPRGSPGLSRLCKSLQPLLGACRSADTRELFPYIQTVLPPFLPFLSGLPSISPVPPCPYSSFRPVFINAKYCS